MSESSSDTESSCGWTIISNEGSDIETLGPETVPDGGPDGETAHGPSTGSEGVPDPSDTISGPEQESTISPAEGSEEGGEHSADSTLKHGTLEETLPISEAGARAAAGGGAAVEVDHVTLSCSDHSDIVTLEPLGAAEPCRWEEPEERVEQAVSEEASAGPEEALYLGTSSSSQYSFGTVEASPLPASPPGGDTTSSSEAEGGEQSSGPTLRRRRTRRNTAPASEPEEGSTLEELPTAPPPYQGQVSGTLNKCILLALVIAISMGFGHFYGTMQVQERQKVAEKLRETELTELRGDLHQCQREQDIIAKSKEAVRQLQEDLEEKRDMVLSLTGLMDKIAKENQQLRLKQAELQAQKEDLSEHLQGAEQEVRRTEARERHLETENLQLRSHLEREEESVSTLQDELRRLRAQMRSLEEQGAAADGMLSENRRLKGHLEDERQRLRAFLGHKEALMAEAQMLRRELDRERGVTEQLKEEVEQLGGGGGGGGEELQARLLELEKKLSFEQQRSDLWERLYVESKEEKARGERGPRAGDKVGADGVMGKVKETFDAVKNSTKEFVHHHKEQIKKAKEAVKENLRKFSDSVKSTFRHFKDSARRVFDKVRRPGHLRHFQERKDGRAERCAGPRECSGEHKAKDAGHGAWAHKPLHQHPRKSTLDDFQGASNTRKPGAAATADPDQATYRASAKGCSGVFDCAYQESMSLFNKALEPIQADEFIQLIRSYLQQEVDHFHHWGELESFINGFFHNGVFIHDQMLFTDFVSGVEDYLEDMDEYQRYDDDVFEDLDDFVYKHFFGDTYSKHYGPSGAFEGPMSGSKDEGPPRQRQQKLPRARPRPQADRKWARCRRGSITHVPNVKIELGPVPFDPKY